MSLLNLLEEFLMFEKIRKMKNKKGFTLVELIVVLVILAILAALLVPALTGYIDKAKQQSIIAECRMTVMATQTLIDEQYATVKLGGTVATAVTIDKNDGAKSSVTTNNGQSTFTISQDEISALSEVKYTDSSIGDVTITANADSGAICKIDKLVYTADGKTCTYENGQYKF